MHRHSVTWVVLFTVIALMFLKLPRMVARQDVVMRTYSALVEVDALAKQKYVEPIGDRRLVHGAIRGMLLQLDRYSGYIAPQQLRALLRRTRGEYIGVGIKIGVRGGRITVIAPIEGGPAAEAGVVSGDVVLAIDGDEVENLSAFDVEERLTGQKGTSVDLRVLHPGESEPDDLTITRAAVSLRTIRGFQRDASGHWDHLIDPEHRIGYIRVTHFIDTTGDDFDAALDELLAGGVAGLVLDLRDNPGGLMLRAVAMVDRFIARGVILETVTRRRAVHQYLATMPHTEADVELVVLINAGSASAAEIVAGSLRAHDRAILVGERSFGKGSVQQLIHLTEHKAAIKLTTAYYRLPDGRVIHRTRENTGTDAWGVKPDILIKLTEAETLDLQRSRRTVARLVRAGGRTPGRPIGKENRVDRQLLAALNHLRVQLKCETTAG